ncbi:MAG: long-chain fatty acid--CoA ligase, partial [Anaerolineaceae bacterium]|nr:long-chain fatty acid--CoA ligase [Anaerolineaceae bacterium]
PNMYNAINQYPDVLAGRYDLRSIKACISGSAPLRKETKETFERLTGGKLLEGYGLSEAPTATHCNPMWGENRTGSIGLPLPDVACQIVDLADDTKILPAGEHGELLIRGPQIMAGYHNMPDESQAALSGNWLHSGDIARMDEDGYFYLVGRKKDLIKIGGFQVWPSEVEEVIAMHPSVAETAVAGVEAGEKGEAVKAWVVLRPGSALSLEELQSWCRQYIARYKVPSLLEIRTELPKTMVGKLLRRELIRQHHQVP